MKIQIERLISAHSANPGRQTVPLDLANVKDVHVEERYDGLFLINIQMKNPCTNLGPSITVTHAEWMHKVLGVEKPKPKFVWSDRAKASIEKAAKQIEEAEE